MKRLFVATIGLALLSGACGDAADAGGAGAAADTTVETTTPAVETPTTAPNTTEQPPLVIEEPIVEEDPKTAPTTISPPEEPVTQPTVSHPDGDVATAMTDLVSRANVAPDDITVVSAEEVTWRDGSLGCPLPGMRYTQALVNGRRIILETGGAQYHYHSGPDRDPFYCANPSDPAPGEGGDL